MAPGSPPHNQAGSLIYGPTGDEDDSDSVPEDASGGVQAAAGTRQSMYVQEFESTSSSSAASRTPQILIKMICIEMLAAVVAHDSGERDLFNEDELECFNTYNALSCQ
jgi:hypothetical protein